MAYFRIMQKFNTICSASEKKRVCLVSGESFHFKSILFGCFCFNVWPVGTLWLLIDQSTAREMSPRLSGSADWPFWINLINLVTLPFCCQSSNQNVKRKLAPLLQAVRKYKPGDQTPRREKPRVC